MKFFFITIVSVMFVTLLSFSFRQEIANAMVPQEGSCRCHTSVMECLDGNLISFRPRCDCSNHVSCSNE